MNEGTKLNTRKQSAAYSKMLLIALEAKASLNTICLITTKMQFYEVIWFVFVEDFMHCVVVSKIPSQLYKFVQLPERLKEKKNQFKLKCNRN